MHRMQRCYNQLSTSKQIALGISFIMALTVLLVSVCLVAQLKNIRTYQQKEPHQFLNASDKQSLFLITQEIKHVILDALDLRRTLLDTIRSALISKQSQFFNQIPIRNDSSSINYLNNIKCILNKNVTIFSCGMDSYADLILLNSNIYLASRPLKRFNLYYINNNNPNDFMFKSLTSTPINPPTVALVQMKMKSVDENKFMFCSYNGDQFSNQNNITSSYRTKIIFHNYTLVLEAQSYGAFIKRSVQRLLYSDTANALILAKNTSNPNGYWVISNLNPPHTQINYSIFFNPGYYEIPFSIDSIIYSYSQLIPSVSDINSQINKIQNDKNINPSNSYILVVYSQSTCITMSSSVINFINKIEKNVLLYVFLGMLGMIGIITLITLFATRKIGKSLNTAKESIQQYTSNPGQCINIMNKLLHYDPNDKIFHFVIRSIYDIIKGIEYKKRKYKIIEYRFDKYPLNLLESQFLFRQESSTLNQLQELRRQIQERSAKKNP